uniref:Ubiquitin-like protease family profile domain-containing protein n=1 Tax=viral metagenome TaxID=1070528 RepID=A0A6C0DRB8_9ZZZZ
MVMNTRKKNKYYNNSKSRKRKQGGADEFATMNCSPLVETVGTINNKSCLTEDVINIIKAEYNKDHPKNPIRSNDKNELWYELKSRLTQCQREDCWLNEIDNKDVRHALDEFIFAPDSPPEWDKNPDEWLSNYDILDVLAQYEKAYPFFRFIGPTPIDFDTRPKEMNGNCVWEELCNFSLKRQLDNGKTKIGVVFNLDKHNESGSHWVSLFVDIDNHFIFYFDSAGDKVPSEIQQLVDRILEQCKELSISMKFIDNKTRHQYENTECGIYALYFITTLLTEKTSDGKLLKTNKDKFAHFSKDRISDSYVFKLRKNKFFNGGSSTTPLTTPENKLGPIKNNNSVEYNIQTFYDKKNKNLPFAETIVTRDGNTSTFDKTVDYNLRRLFDIADIDNMINNRLEYIRDLKRKFRKENSKNKDIAKYLTNSEYKKQYDQEYEKKEKEHLDEKLKDYDKENKINDINELYPVYNKNNTIIPISRSINRGLLGGKKSRKNKLPLK